MIKRCLYFHRQSFIEWPCKEEKSFFSRVVYITKSRQCQQIPCYLYCVLSSLRFYFFCLGFVFCNFYWLNYYPLYRYWKLAGKSRQRLNKTVITLSRRSQKSISYCTRTIWCLMHSRYLSWMSMSSTSISRCNNAFV